MSIVTDLEKSLVKLNNTSYDSVDKLMKKVAKDNDISATELHHKFKAKHNMIPDDWIKKQMNEGTLHNWFGKSKSKDGKPGWVQSDGSPCANEPGEKGTPKCYSSRRLAGLKKSKEGKSKIRSADARKSRQDPGQQSKSGGAKPTMVRTFKDPKDYKKHKSGDYKSEGYEMQEAKDQKGSGSGTKDACYSKVKSRYSVWPSAYASGALVKCRKVGAANWGNSKKNEEFMALPEFTDIQIRCMEAAGIEVEVLDEKCWVGYTQKGMKKKGKKVVPNCVPVGEGYAPGDVDQKVGAVTSIPKKEQDDAKARILAKTKAKREKMKEENTIEEATRVPAQNGNVYLVGFTWRGKYMMMKLFFPEVKRPSRNEVKDALEKIYPGCHLQRFDLTPYNPSEPMINVGVSEEVEELEEKSAAWQRKEGKNKEGGLNEKGRKSYERENPGSDLKAPQPEGGPRKKSFCARMGGVKGPMKKPNGEPTRKALALRKWKC